MTHHGEGVPDNNNKEARNIGEGGSSGHDRKTSVQRVFHGAAIVARDGLEDREHHEGADEGAEETFPANELERISLVESEAFHQLKSHRKADENQHTDK